MRPPQDEPHYQGAGSAEGQANADFLRLLRHGISHDAVNADAGQHQSYAGEDSKQYHPQALTPSGVVHPARHRADLEYRDTWVDVAHRVADRLEGARGVGCRPHRDRHERKRHLLKGKIELLARRAVQAEVLHVAHDANNLALSGDRCDDDLRGKCRSH